MKNFNFELAFEEGFEKGVIHRDLYRVASTREHGSISLRHTNWFISESAAKKHAEWIDKNGGTVISILYYRLVIN